MKVVFSKSPSIWLGTLAYSWPEHSLSFDFDRDAMSLIERGASISFMTLQIEIDIRSKRFLFPWGYFPLVNAIKKNFLPFSYEDGQLILENVNLTRGVSVPFDGADKWVKMFDQLNKWIYFGPREFDIGNQRVQFCKGAIACITDGDIRAFIFRLS